MGDVYLILFYGIIIFFVGKWLIKTYITEPQKDKRIGEYKFAEFKEALREYNISTEPVKGSENQLTFRELISNGVENIGDIDYSINDYIKYTGNNKIHNYFFNVEARVRDTKFSEKSEGYLKTFDVETCKIQIAVLRKKIVNNPDYQGLLRFNQLR